MLDSWATRHADVLLPFCSPRHERPRHPTKGKRSYQQTLPPTIVLSFWTEIRTKIINHDGMETISALLPPFCLFNVQCIQISLQNYDNEMSVMCNEANTTFRFIYIYIYIYILHIYCLIKQYIYICIYIYILGNLGFCFHHYCAVYDACKYSITWIYIYIYCLITKAKYHIVPTQSVGFRFSTRLLFIY